MAPMVATVAMVAVILGEAHRSTPWSTTVLRENFALKTVSQEKSKLHR